MTKIIIVLIIMRLLYQIECALAYYLETPWIVNTIRILYVVIMISLFLFALPMWARIIYVVYSIEITFNRKD